MTVEQLPAARLQSLGEHSPPGRPGEYPDFASLRSAWTHHEDAYASYFGCLTKAQLDAQRTVDAETYTLGNLIQHTLNDSTFITGKSNCFYGNSATNPRPPATVPS